MSQNLMPNNQTEKPISLFQTLKQKLGLDAATLESINDPNFDELQNLGLMADTLEQLRKNALKIVVLPDFDMDGVSAGITAYAGLSEMGFNTELFVPSYLAGHDISPAIIDNLFARHPGASAIITCDGGTNSVRGMQRAQELGLTTLITDHHLQVAPNPYISVIVNPLALGETYSHPGISGSFVTWQVLYYYAQTYQPNKVRDIKLLKLFAGLGNVSDVMPILYENRQTVKDSIAIAKMLYVPLLPEDSATEYLIDNSVLLSLLKSKPHHKAYLDAFEGFATVLQVFREYGGTEPILDHNGDPRIDDDGTPIVKELSGKLRLTSDITEELYGFYITPAFNAIRRIEGDIEHAFGIFTADTQEEKLAHAKQIIDYNEFRKVEVERHMEELTDFDQPWAPWVWVTDAPGGMKGLIAAKLMEAQGTPVAVISLQEDPLTPNSGSARAPNWFNIVTLMQGPFFSAIGHEQACGVFMNNETAITLFRDRLEEKSQEIIDDLIANGEDVEATPVLKLGVGDDVDDNLKNPDEIAALAEGLSTLRPFGKDFENPTLELNLDLTSIHLTTLGEDKTHIKITTQSGLKILGWSMADQIPLLDKKKKSTEAKDHLVKIPVTLSENIFRGEVTPQFIIRKGFEFS